MVWLEPGVPGGVEGDEIRGVDRPRSQRTLGATARTLILD